MEEKQITLEIIELQTGHYYSLFHALAAAMTRCMTWRNEENQEKYDAMQLLEYAETFDKEYPVNQPSFYMVSAEGAIGLSPGVEYLTRWMFVPYMEEEPAQEEKPAPVVEPIPVVELEPVQQPTPVVEPEPVQEPTPVVEPAPEQAVPSVARPKFCPECGTPYKSETARFCANCGKPRQ